MGEHVARILELPGSIQIGLRARVVQQCCDRPSMPCSAGVRTTSPPSRRIIKTRSPLTVLGMYARNGTPTVAQTMLNAIDVDPLDASPRRVEGDTSPDRDRVRDDVGRHPVLRASARQQVVELQPERAPGASSSKGMVGVSSGSRNSQDARSMNLDLTRPIDRLPDSGRYCPLLAGRRPPEALSNPDGRVVPRSARAA